MVWTALILVDKAVNYTLGWVIGGGLLPWGWTISDRLWHLRAAGSRIGRVGCRLLNLMEPEHCEKAIQSEVDLPDKLRRKGGL